MTNDRTAYQNHSFSRQLVAQNKLLRVGPFLEVDVYCRVQVMAWSSPSDEHNLVCAEKGFFDRG